MRCYLIYNLASYATEDKCRPLRISWAVGYGFGKFCQRFTTEVNIEAGTGGDAISTLQAHGAQLVFRKRYIKRNYHVSDCLITPAVIELLLTVASEKKPPLFTLFHQWVLQEQHFLKHSKGIWMRVVLRKNE